ncbi:interferon-induced GTP-binding protein Mx3-like [Mantella aurantiaca]
MIGFTNFRTFKNIAKKKVLKFEDPAIVKLNEITKLVGKSFINIASKYFLQFPNLYRSAQGIIDNVCSMQQKEAEKAIRTQFKFEKIIYCQDTLYGETLKKAREETRKKSREGTTEETREMATEPSLSENHLFFASPIWGQQIAKPKKPLSKARGARDATKLSFGGNLFFSFGSPVVQGDQLQLSVNEMSLHIQSYFKTATARLTNQIPLIIQHYALFELAQQLQVQMMELIQDKAKLNVLLMEKCDMSIKRKTLEDKIKRLKAAQERLREFPL